MPTITATNDGNINANLQEGFGGSWDGVRDATSGGVASSQTSTNTGLARIVVFSFGGATRWIIHRSFYEFDTSGIVLYILNYTMVIMLSLVLFVPHV